MAAKFKKNRAELMLFCLYNITGRNYSASAFRVRDLITLNLDSEYSSISWCNWCLRRIGGACAVVQEEGRQTEGLGFAVKVLWDFLGGYEGQQRNGTIGYKEGNIDDYVDSFDACQDPHSYDSVGPYRVVCERFTL